MIFWEEGLESENPLFNQYCNWEGAYVFDFKYSRWFRQCRDFKIGHCASSYEHRDFWSGYLDVLLDPERRDTEGKFLPLDGFVLWNAFGVPTPEQIAAWPLHGRRDQYWQSDFIKVAVVKVDFSRVREIPKALGLLQDYQAPKWFDPRVSAWERLRQGYSVIR